jgi:hypothetical protein
VAHVSRLLHFPRPDSTARNSEVHQPDEKTKDADGQSETQDANVLEFRQNIFLDEMSLD